MRAASQLRIFATLLVLAAWVVVLRGLLDYLPALDLHLWFNIGLSALAIPLAVLAGLTYREASKELAS